MTFEQLSEQAKLLHEENNEQELEVLLNLPIAFKDAHKASSLVAMLFKKSTILAHTYSHFLPLLIQKGYTPEIDDHATLRLVLERYIHGSDSSRTKNAPQILLLLRHYIQQDWECCLYLQMISIHNKKDMLNHYMNVSGDSYSDTMALAKGEYLENLIKMLNDSVKG